MRNEHVAHRVSDAEQMKVMVVLTPPPLERHAHGCLTLSARFTGPDEPRCTAFLDVANQLVGLVAIDRDALQQELLTQAGERLDGLYRDTDQSVTPGEPPTGDLGG